MPDWMQPEHRHSVARFCAWARDALGPAGWDDDTFRRHDLAIPDLVKQFGEEDPVFLDWTGCKNELYTQITFGENCAVLLFDLRTKPELNGRLGRLLRFHVDKRRWEVALVSPAALRTWLTVKDARGSGMGQGFLRGREQDTSLFRADNLLRLDTSGYWIHFGP